MAFQLIITSTFKSNSYQRSCKRRYAEDKLILAILEFGLEHAQKKQYLTPWLTRLSSQIKKQYCFDKWFKKCDCTWVIVVCQCCSLASKSRWMTLTFAHIRLGCKRRPLYLLQTQSLVIQYFIITQPALELRFNGSSWLKWPTLVFLGMVDSVWL